MVDRDLALLYGVETRRLNEQVKRNIENWKSQIATSNKEIIAFCFYRAVLKSQTAVQTSIQIIKSFVGMRNNASLFTRIDSIEKRQISYEIKSRCHRRKRNISFMMDKFSMHTFS